MAKTFLSPLEDAAPTAIVYKEISKKKRKSKRSRGTRRLERAARRGLETDSAFLKRYLVLHKKSNSKRRDGWARDLDINLLRAVKAGRKKIKLRSQIGL